MSSSSYLKGRAITVSEDRANSTRPILKWIKEAAPRTRERVQASSLLRKIEGIKGWKQILLTKGETELLEFVYSEFPEGAAPEEGRQLELLTFANLEDAIHGKRTPFKVSGLKIHPVLKKDLTPEEQAEKDATLDQAKYQAKPEKYWQKGLRGEQD